MKEDLSNWRYYGGTICKLFVRDTARVPGNRFGLVTQTFKTVNSLKDLQNS